MSPASRGRLVLLVVFLVFFLPVLGAWLLNILAPHWHPFGRVNQGTLVDPPLRVRALALRTPAGEPVAADLFAGHWTLVQVQRSRCAAACLATLAVTRQTRLALGENVARVQRLLVQRPGATPADLSAEDRDLNVVVAPAPWPDGGPDASAGSRDAAASPPLLLVDPQGYLILRYPPGVSREALHADLTRLLKISKIG